MKNLTTEPLDDCAIRVVVTHPGGEAKFKLKRIPSHGKHSKSITFRANGHMDVGHPRKEPGHRFLISFILPPEDSSGGFSGMKIWPVNGNEPEDYILPRHGEVAHIGKAFDLRAHHSPGDGKVTMLTLSDDCSVRGRYHYALGVFQDKKRDKHRIDEHDPQIYNTGDVGEGGD